MTAMINEYKYNIYFNYKTVQYFMEFIAILNLIKVHLHGQFN